MVRRLIKKFRIKFNYFFYDMIEELDSSLDKHCNYILMQWDSWRDTYPCKKAMLEVEIGFMKIQIRYAFIGWLCTDMAKSWIENALFNNTYYEFVAWRPLLENHTSQYK